MPFPFSVSNVKIRVTILPWAALCGVVALASSCTKKKSGSDDPKDTPTAAATKTPVQTTGEIKESPGPSPGPSPGTEPTKGPSSGVGEVKTKSGFGVPPASPAAFDQTLLQAILPELSNLVHLVSPVFSAQGVALTDLQQKSTDCANAVVKSALLKATAEGFTIEVGQEFSKCLSANEPKMSSGETRNWKADLSWSFRGNCHGHSFNSENGLSVANEDVVRHLCQNSTQGEFYFHLEFDSKELGEGGKVVSSMKRTRALLGNQGASCSFVRDALTGARSYQDCLQFEKVERDGATPLYLESVFEKDAAVGLFDAKGIRFSSTSAIKVKVNNWSGTVSFSKTATDLPSIKLSNGTTAFEGKSLFPFPSSYSKNSGLYAAAVISQAANPSGSASPSGPSSPTGGSQPTGK